MFGSTLRDATACKTSETPQRRVKNVRRFTEGNSMKHLSIIFLALLALAACQDEDAASFGTPTKDACGAQALSNVLGTPHTDHDFSSPQRPHRIIPPNSAVTMDHRPDRLNVDVDDAGEITRLWCG
ncbi:I78 family peptidase inhibitor [Roseovarius aestuarii]|nr:I78 family peptidase inhibitor [Roseovarius aestuarii]